jgi:hypothetical protein
VIMIVLGVNGVALLAYRNMRCGEGNNRYHRTVIWIY